MSEYDSPEKYYRCLKYMGYPITYTDTYPYLHQIKINLYDVFGFCYVNFGAKQPCSDRDFFSVSISFVSPTKVELEKDQWLPEWDDIEPGDYDETGLGVSFLRRLKLSKEWYAYYYGKIKNKEPLNEWDKGMIFRRKHLRKFAEREGVDVCPPSRR